MVPRARGGRVVHPGRIPDRRRVRRPGGRLGRRRRRVPGGRPGGAARALDAGCGRCAGPLARVPLGRVPAGRGDDPAGGPRPCPPPGAARSRRRDPRGDAGPRDRRAAARVHGLARRRSTPGAHPTASRVRSVAAGPGPHAGRRGPGPCRCRRPQRVGRGLALVRPTAGDLVVVHRPDRADPRPPGRDRLDRRRGLADARFTLYYLRTTPDGRIAIGGGGGRAGFGGRIDGVFTDDVRSARRAVAGLRRLFPSLRDVRIEDAWGGPIDITADHVPWFGSVPGRPIHHGLGYSGNGVGPSLLGGRILAARAVERDDDPVLALPLASGRPPRAFPRNRPGPWARRSSARPRPAARPPRTKTARSIG